MNSFASLFLLVAVFIFNAPTSSAQVDSLMNRFYDEMRGDSTLTIRLDEQDGLPFLVFYPNGEMREHYRMSGFIEVSEDLEAVWVSLVIPADLGNLDVS